MNTYRVRYLSKALGVALWIKVHADSKAEAVLDSIGLPDVYTITGVERVKE